MYSHGNARNDHSVLHYGFLDRSRWEQPRVCCSDLDGADLWNCSAVDRDSRELGAAEDGERAMAMRKSETKRASLAPNYEKTGNEVFSKSPHFALFLRASSASSLTPISTLDIADPAEQDALQDRYAAKLASFPTSVRDDESVLSGKQRSFRACCHCAMSAMIMNSQCNALCDKRAAHRPLQNHAPGLRDQTAWKARLLIEFRVLRKRALQQAIDNLRAMPERARDEL